MMNRRDFLYLTVSSGVGAGAWLHGRQNATPPATPEDASRLNPAPEPIDLGFGVSVVDYHFGESATTPKMLIEIVNDNDYVVDTPRLLTTFRDASDNILMEERTFTFNELTLPRERGQLFIEFYGDDPATVGYERIQFEAMDQLGASSRLGSLYTLDYDIEIDEEEQGDSTYLARGIFTNTGERNITSVDIRGVFRNEAGRYIGHTWWPLQSTLSPGQSTNFTLDVGVSVAVPHDPFDFLEPDESYTVDIFAEASV